MNEEADVNEVNWEIDDLYPTRYTFDDMLKDLSTPCRSLKDMVSMPKDSQIKDKPYGTISTCNVKPNIAIDDLVKASYDLTQELNVRKAMVNQMSFTKPAGWDVGTVANAVDSNVLTKNDILKMINDCADMIDKNKGIRNTQMVGRALRPKFEIPEIKDFTPKREKISWYTPMSWQNDVRDEYVYAPYIPVVKQNLVAAINTGYTHNCNEGCEDTEMSNIAKRDFQYVNSKLLVKTIDDFITDFVEGPAFSLQSSPHVLTAIDIINDLMYELTEDGKIMNYKVIADERNNKPNVNHSARLNIDIYFRQTNCINRTHLHYELRE